MAYALIDWLAPDKKFTVRRSRGVTVYVQSAEQAIAEGKREDNNLRVNEQMPAEKLIEVMAAAIFARVPLCNLQGKEITETPVPDAKVSYITRKELGAVLPDGWYIECQLNRYAACWGDQMTFPARTRLASAIADIQQFLASSVKQASEDLIESVAASRDLAEMEQVPMWLSSDSPQGAVENSTELDSIAPSR